jgi:transcriptional regulator with XRE-family HTH domain
LLWNEQTRLFQQSGRRIIGDEMRRASLTPNQARQLGKFISTRREQRGLSMRQLAREIDGNIATISFLEAGTLLSPQPDTLKAIARVLNVPVSDLFVTADWLPAEELPTFKPYLRAKYHGLDEQAIADIEAYANQRAQRHGSTGPIHREDEQP